MRGRFQTAIRGELLGLLVVGCVGRGIPNEYLSGEHDVVNEEESTFGEMDSGAMATGGEDGSFGCDWAVVDETIETVPAIRTGTSLGAPQVPSMCHPDGGASPSSVVRFVAPRDGLYRFDTWGSGFDTLLTIYDDLCGTQQVCNDDSEEDLWSKVDRELRAGEELLLVIGAFDDPGDWQLNVEEVGGAVACEPMVLDDEIPFRAEGEFSSQTLVGSCGGEGPEAVFSFIAQRSETLSISAEVADPSIQPIVYVLDGDCGSRELTCSVGRNSFFADAVIDAEAGQELIIVVDSDGEGVLEDVSLVIDDVPDCVDVVSLSSSLFASLTGYLIDQGPFATASRCTDVNPGAWVSYVAPVTGTYRVSTVGSDVDTVLSIRQGSCGGEELDCNDDRRGLWAEIDINLLGGQLVFIAVSEFSGNEGSYALSIERVE